MSENNPGYETSPYLLQHAKNPVHWHAWNEEALARAKKENKPNLSKRGIQLMSLVPCYGTRVV
ncbi:MAG: hypothetical protein CM1200mP23_2670 [Nitrososphaerota archaeon]|nr:MAG: hypothetical protein CM1200mP23_2670 [Nitrososphaerota archaeon]